MDLLVHWTHYSVCVFSENIGMEFGIEKCAILVMEEGKIVKSVGREFPEVKFIKYLEIFEVDKLLEEKMKLNVLKNILEG